MQNYNFLASDPAVNSPGGDHPDILALHRTALSNNAGTGAPSQTEPHMWWADETANRLKRRNAADTAWIDWGALDLPTANFLHVEPGGRAVYEDLSVQVDGPTGVVRVQCAAAQLKGVADLSVYPFGTQNHTASLLVGANNEWKRVWLTRAPSGGALHVEAQSATPTFAAGVTHASPIIDVFRLNDGTVLSQRSHGANMLYAAPANVVDGGNQTTPTAFNLAGYVPALATGVWFQVEVYRSDVSTRWPRLLLRASLSPQEFELQTEARFVRTPVFLPLLSRDWLYRVDHTLDSTTVKFLGYQWET